MEMKYATNRLIDSVWTLEYQIIDGKVEIHSYNRDNPIGYEKEKELPQVKLQENDNRIVERVRFREYEPYNYGEGYNEVYDVSNPKHVFSYDGKQKEANNIQKTTNKRPKRKMR